VDRVPCNLKRVVFESSQERSIRVSISTNSIHVCQLPINFNLWSVVKVYLFVAFFLGSSIRFDQSMCCLLQMVMTAMMTTSCPFPTPVHPHSSTNLRMLLRGSLGKHEQRYIPFIFQNLVFFIQIIRIPI
jgi:hypothetical protein